MFYENGNVAILAEKSAASCKPFHANDSLPSTDLSNRIVRNFRLWTGVYSHNHLQFFYHGIVVVTSMPAIAEEESQDQETDHPRRRRKVA